MPKGMRKNPKFKGRPMRKKPKKFSPGGYLVGPSHDDGGIMAMVDGVEPIEVEGGEFIINKQTVDALGEDFLHKLNSTETTHHTGGFGAGELPSPSQFKDGGKVRRNEMARGRRRAPRRGTAPARKMARGGRSRSTGIKKYPHGGMHCGPGMTMAANGGCVPMAGGGYRKGGRTRPKPIRKFHQGAGINPNHSHPGDPSRRGRGRGTNTMGMMYNVGGQTHSAPNKGCQIHSGDATSCNNHPSCTYNYSTGMCH